MLWKLVSAVLAFLIFLLCIKIYLLKKAAEEICEGLSEKLGQDTNTLLTLSTNDRHIKRLAARLNEELRELRTRRQRYQQGDQELKETVANLSHDLRTPLTAVFGYLSLLEKEEKSEAASRYLTMIENRCQVLKQQMEELFRYSLVLSAPGLTMEPVTVNSVLEESLALAYGAFVQKKIRPQLHLTEEKITRFLDRDALHRIFDNLIQNALKYSDGDLTVTLKSDGTIQFANRAHKLTSVDAARLFDRFYTIETAGGSTGLGLSIAKHLTGQMGGSIEASCRDGILTVTVRFPEGQNGGQNGNNLVN